MPVRYRRGMELRLLRYFVAVAEELHFSRAARRLRVAQPALSRAIRRLEEELGAPLFERSPRAVMLTPAGEAFLPEARSLLEHCDKVVRAARRGTAGVRRLAVGYVWGLFHTSGPAAVRRFRLRHPEVAVNLLDLSATDQAAAIREGRIDLGFIGFAEEADALGLPRRRIDDCTLVAALPRAHPRARLRSVPLANLAEELFLGISEVGYPGAARWVSAACQAAGFRPRMILAAERGHAVLGLVAANCGVALLPEPLKMLPHTGVVFRPITPACTAPLHVAWRDDPPSSAVAEFLQTLPGGA